MAGKKVNRLIVPNVYTANGVEPVTSVNNILPINGNVTLPIPTVPTNVSAFTNDAGYLTSATLDGYATQLWVQQQGYLTSIPNTYLQNTATGSDSLTILGTAQTTIMGTNIGYYTQVSDLSNAFGFNAKATGMGAEAFGSSCTASGNFSIRIGNSGTASGNYSIAIGPTADASAKYAIQLGEGTNSTASSLQIGFGTSKNYTLLNGTTGLIPDARISSNIARTTDIPDVSNFVTNSSLSTTLADYVTNASLTTTLSDYALLSNLPTVNDTTITIQKNGVDVDNFTLNQSANKSINIIVPTDTNDLTNGAEFLVSNATGTNALAVGKTSQSTAEGGVAIGYDARANSTYSTAVGENTRATNTNTTVIGRAAKATQARAIAIGSGAEANAQDAIAIKGINNTANTFQVYTYNMLDMSTGLIPDARMSTNIARVTDIPTVPTNISAFTNDSGYITGISSSDVTTALGYTPYNSSNPNGYTSNTGTVTSVNNVSPVNGNVTLSIPTVPTNVSAFTNDSGYQTSSDVNTTVTNAISTLLGNLYPVGSVYIGTQATCPLTTLISGSTWELVAEDRVLQGSSTNHSANTTVAAGLPDITGNITSRSYTTQYSGAITGATGALSYTRNATSSTISPVSVTGTAVKGDVTQFKASNSNSIYGSSTTVQPPAYVVNIWRRTA